MKTISSYVVGFILSLLLTCAAYLFVVDRLLSGSVLIFAIVLLAIIQLYVQLIFFLHLGRGQSARWRITMFFLTAMTIGIVIGGSLWIMHNLNYRHMSPMEVQQYLDNQSGF